MEVEEQKQKEFVEYILKILVDHPDDLDIEISIEEKSIVFKVKANVEDYGKIIGRRGKSINAIRTLLSVVSRNMGKKRCVIDILDREKRE